MSKQTVSSYFGDVFKSPSPQFEFLLGYKSNQTVVSCVICYEREYASIYWVGTIPSERRQGFGTLIMGEALQRIRRRNIRWVVLQATVEGFKMYQNLGFLSLGYLARY